MAVQQKTKTKTMGNSGKKIRIKLKGFDNRLVDQAAGDIVETVMRSGTHTVGPIPFPTTIEKFSVNRSPHSDKKSAEQFELRTHKRVIDILDPNADTIDALKKVNLPTGVEITIGL